MYNLSHEPVVRLSDNGRKYVERYIDRDFMRFG